MKSLPLNTITKSNVSFAEKKNGPKTPDSSISFLVSATALANADVGKEKCIVRP